MLSELIKNHRNLIVAGAVCIACLFVLAIVFLFDSTEILGINRWIKPMKFFVSVAIYLWTIAIYLYFLKDYAKSARFVSWAMIAIFAAELLIVVAQAARGTKSHFNLETPLDGALYGIMGISIVLNTLLAFYVLFLYFQAEINLPKSIVWGMRLGLILFLAASFEGGYMSAQIGHSVGVADGSDGLPIVNWSTNGGDLRVAHFFGMHALQVVPFFSYTLEKYKIKSPTTWTLLFALFYLSVFTFLFVQALNGQPLIKSF